jgi:hypothetical protein
LAFVENEVKVKGGKEERRKGERLARNVEWLGVAVHGRAISICESDAASDGSNCLSIR